MRDPELCRRLLHVLPAEGIAITFHAAQLGFEAQHAVAVRLMRLVGDASKTNAGGTIADEITAPPQAVAQRLRQAVAEGVSPSSRSTKSDRARTSASALNKRYSLNNSAPRTRSAEQ
jgi:hypothetical protein